MGTCFGKLKHKLNHNTLNQDLEVRPTKDMSVSEDLSLDAPPPVCSPKIIVKCANNSIEREFMYNNRLCAFSIILQLKYDYPFLSDKEVTLYHNDAPISDFHMSFPELGIEPDSVLNIEIRDIPQKVKDCDLPPDLQEIIGSSLLDRNKSNYEINYTCNLKENMKNLNSSLSKEVLRDVLMKTIHEFQKNLDEKGFRTRLNLELTGFTHENLTVDNLIDQMHIIFYNLAYDIHIKGYQHPANMQEAGLKSMLYTDGITVSMKLSPWIDRTWRLMISYINIYYNFCKSLIGRPIDRLIDSDRFYNLEYVKTLWPGYNLILAKIEDDYMIWVSPAKYLKLLQYLRTTLFKRNDTYLSYKLILLEDIMALLQDMQKLCRKEDIDLKSKISIKNNTTKKDEAPKGKSVKDSIDEMIFKDQIIKSIRRQIIDDEDAAIQYVEEYINYLTVVSFSDLVMIPSDKIEQVFKIHQDFSENYRQVSREVYGEFRSSNPLNPLQVIGVTVSEQYTRTKQLYPLILMKKSIHRFWPSRKIRFSYKYLNGHWVSLIRLVGCFISLANLQVINSEDNLVDIKEALRIPYMEWPNKDSSNLEVLQSTIHTQSDSSRRFKGRDLLSLYQSLQES